MKSSAIEGQFQAAIELRNDGRFDEALEILRSLSQRTEGKESAAVCGVIGGILLFEKGAAAKAVSYFRRCTEMSPSSEKASLGLFHSLWECGDREAALSEMRRFVSAQESIEYNRLLEGLRPQLEKTTE